MSPSKQKICEWSGTEVSEAESHKVSWLQHNGFIGMS